jgi:hypothetical protein
VRNHIETDLEQLIDEIVDDEAQVSEVQEKIFSVIDKRLNIEQMDIYAPNVSLDELKQVDKELEQKKKEYEEMRKQLSQMRHQREKHENLVEEQRKIEEELRRLKKRKDVEMDLLGDVRPHTGMKTVKEEQIRTGLFGKIGNVLLGPKVVEKQEFYMDEQEVQWAEQKRKQIQQQYSMNIQNQEIQLRTKIEEMYENRYNQHDLLDIEQDTRETKTEFLRQKQEAADRKRQMTARIIKVNMNQFHKEVKKFIYEYLDEIDTFLNENRKVITHLLKEILEVEKEEIEERKNNIYHIQEMAGKTPEELEQEVNRIHREMTSLLDMIQYVKIAKEGI